MSNIRSFIYSLVIVVAVVDGLLVGVDGRVLSSFCKALLLFFPDEFDNEGFTLK